MDLQDVKRGNTYFHKEHGEVTFIASDPHDGAYLICSYWIHDEQVYFGCEARDLKDGINGYYGPGAKALLPPSKARPFMVMDVPTKEVRTLATFFLNKWRARGRP